jgi:hypothetical protein
MHLVRVLPPQILLTPVRMDDCANDTPTKWGDGRQTSILADTLLGRHRPTPNALPITETAAKGSIGPAPACWQYFMRGFVVHFQRLGMLHELRQVVAESPLLGISLLFSRGLDGG